MSVRINLTALGNNAALARGTADAAGLGLNAVIKDPFADLQIIDVIAGAGIDAFSFPTLESALAFDRSQSRRYHLVGLILPDQAYDAIRGFDSSLHTSRDTIKSIAVECQRLKGRHDVWIGVFTSDEREGLTTDDVLLEAPNWREHFTGGLSLKGLLAHWGCRHDQVPKVAQVNSFLDLVGRTEDALGKRLSVSVGGSALLPLLNSMVFNRRDGCLRVGEAILTGTIPGSDAKQFGLKRCVSMDAKVVEVAARSINGRQCIRLVIDHGATTLDWRDIEFEDLQGTAIWGASEVTVIEIAPGAASPRLGESLRIRLGFNSALRALANCRMKRTFIT